MADQSTVRPQSIDTLSRQLAQCERALTDAQETLVTNRQKFRDTFDNAAIGLAHLSCSGQWIRVNPALCEILGFSESELLTMTFCDVTHPEDLEMDQAQTDRLLAGEIARYTIEKRYVRKNGTPLWVRLHAALVRTSDDKPSYFVAVVENIDERKQVERALMLGRQRHEIVLSAARLGVFDFFGDGDPRNYWSYWVRRHFGIDDHSALDYARFARLFHTDDWPYVERELTRCMKEPGSRYQVEYRTIGEQDRILRWIEASGQSLYDSEEGAIRLCGTTLDITARKIAELALQVREARFRKVFDNIPDVVVIYDRDLRIRYVNPVTTCTTGLPPAAFIGKTEAEVFPTGLIASWQPALKTALREEKTTSIDVALPLKSGIRHCHITYVPLTDDAGQVVEIMGITHDFTDRKNAQEQALRAALHDPLTGLPNRILLFEYSAHIFDHAVRQHHMGAVMYIDLDRFKQINDLHGHEVGDQLLVEVVGRIRNIIRRGDLLFRLGGDEFLVMLPEITGESESAQIADRLVAALAEPYTVEPLSLLASASIGISLFPSDGHDIHELVRASDSAMYLAKHSGKNTWRFFSHALSTAARKTIELQNHIRGALARNEFELVYQPVIDIATGSVCAAEALLRWPAGNTGPEEFVPAAEVVGQIVSIGDWVIDRACQTHRDWLDAGLPAVPVAVNVSALQLRQRDFLSKLHDTLHRHRLPPSALQLELTETAVLEDEALAIGLLRQFRSDGIRILLDDFGTGYSSLAYLTKLPIDKIKIDKSFVQTVESDEACRAVTEAIVAIARRLKLEIVAEGIETHEVLQTMLELGCHQIQGYLISHACAADKFATCLREGLMPQMLARSKLALHPM